MNWYLECLRNYAQFDGRARRTEYWMFTLINALILIALAIAGCALIFVTSHGGRMNSGLPFLFMAPIWLYTLAMLIPGLAVSARRLHDTGRSGWWMLIAFIPFGSIVLLIFHLIDSEPGPNQYGPNPKQAAYFTPTPPPQTFPNY